MTSPSDVFSVSTEGRSVAEATIADEDEAEALLAAARRAGSDLAWAHSAADLSQLGISRQWGTAGLKAARDLRATVRADDPARMISVTRLYRSRPEQESPELWAEAFRGQWGHKTAQQWPLDLPPGTATLGLRRALRDVDR